MRSRYSRDEILAAMRRWRDKYGEPPTMTDWEPARARRLRMAWRAERFESDSWPTTRIVIGHFSSFSEAVKLAGLPARPAPTRVAYHLTDPSAVLEAILEWTRRYGDVPAMADWDPVRARRLGQDWRIARYNQGDWPSTRTVLNHFASFGAAIEAAGFLRRPRSASRDERARARAENQRRAAEASAVTRPGGVDDLAKSLRTLAVARSARDPVGMRTALLDVAASALAWADRGAIDGSYSRVARPSDETV
jgi:hypothetical protein